jgi:hypothetical protein
MQSAQWLGSPNFSPNRDGHHMHFDGPDRADASYIVLHTIVGSIAGANARFQQSAQQASAHYGVGLDGRLVQWVRESDAAWHAGDYPMNLDSVGIEHEDGGDYNGPRTPALYATSAALVADLCARYGIPCNRTYIRKHNEVSDAPTGCPDGLDVEAIVAAAGLILNPPAPVDIRPEWVKNLAAHSAEFTLYRHVDIVRMPTGDLVGSVPPGPLTVAFTTEAGGNAYYVTAYGSSVGNGLRVGAVAAAAVAPPPPPPPLQLYRFRPDPPNDLHPPDGVMAEVDAAKLAAEWALANPGFAIYVDDAAGATVYRAGFREPGN